MMPGEILKPAPKIFPEFCNIVWESEPQKLHNFVRGLSPYPCARTVFKNEKRTITCKIFESQPETAVHLLHPGQIVSDGKYFIKIACKGGFLKILSLQAEGKRRLGTEEFLRGFKIEEFSVPVN
jgi:methionyl-tRNA formyltransferase